MKGFGTVVTGTLVVRRASTSRARRRSCRRPAGEGARAPGARRARTARRGRPARGRQPRRRRGRETCAAARRWRPAGAFARRACSTCGSNARRGEGAAPRRARAVPPGHERGARAGRVSSLVADGGHGGGGWRAGRRDSARAIGLRPPAARVAGRGDARRPLHRARVLAAGHDRRRAGARPAAAPRRHPHGRPAGPGSPELDPRRRRLGAGGRARRVAAGRRGRARRPAARGADRPARPAHRPGAGAGRAPAASAARWSPIGACLLVRRRTRGDRPSRCWSSPEAYHREHPMEERDPARGSTRAACARAAPGVFEHVIEDLVRQGRITATDRLGVAGRPRGRGRRRRRRRATRSRPLPRRRSPTARPGGARRDPSG